MAVSRVRQLLVYSSAKPRNRLFVDSGLEPSLAVESANDSFEIGSLRSSRYASLRSVVFPRSCRGGNRDSPYSAIATTAFTVLFDAR
jgi:hypothetical protein